VLVVDDNVDGAELLAQLLQRAGCDVRIAHQGGRALEIAARFEPQLCLLDIGLPDMSGLELASRLRASSAAAGSLLIAVSGYGQATAVARSSAAGLDAHLVKPVTLAQLERAIRKI
jgi:CheY-like chemotaxis protein